MKAPQHFALSFLGPLIAGALFCGVVIEMWDWLKEHGLPPLMVMAVGGLVAAVVTRWFVSNCVSVKCPFCGGGSYEIPDRGNRFLPDLVSLRGQPLPHRVLR